MLIAVAGGKLQGVEAVYLAQKAGFQTIIIDKNPDAPAVRLCDQFIKFEFKVDNPVPPDCPKPDLILPAIEDEKVLSLIQVWAKKCNIPFAFDMNAYLISSSKIKSDKLFHKMHLPAPEPWPGCGFPVVVKPDNASGSHDVAIIDNATDFSSRFSTIKIPDNTIVQQFLDGDSFSIEVLGQPGSYQALQVTDLSMDKDYDCKKVTAPTRLSQQQIRNFKKMGIAIAREINLNGIMDVEVILHQNKLKLLEIDARLPSQTPITVFWSTGINMVQILTNLFVDNSHVSNQITCQTIPWRARAKYERAVIVEHIKVCEQKIEFAGEHIMTMDGSLKVMPDFFGSNEAITSFEEDKNQWVATMIFCGASQNEISVKRDACYKKIVEHMKNCVEEPVH